MAIWRQLTAIEQPLVVAVSGGVDSMVLLHRLLEKMPKDKLIVVHVNHMMRANSDRDQNFVREFAKTHQLIFETNTDAPPLMNEQEAREFRYAFLNTIVQKYEAAGIVLGHHRDDQVETVMMSLIRNGSLKSTVGMSEKVIFENVTLYRPMLSITKKYIVDYAWKHQISYVQDETNDLDGYTRNRFRHHIMPLLQNENVRYDEHVAHFSNHLNELLSFADELVEQKSNDYIQNDQIVNLLAFRQEQKFIQKSIIAKWLVNEKKLTRYVVETVNRLILEQNGTKEVTLNPDLKIVVSYHSVRIEKNDAIDASGECDVIKLDVSNGETVCSKADHSIWKIKQIDEKAQWNEEQPTILSIDSDEFPLAIRFQCPGDTISLKEGRKKIARVFIDAKIPKNERKHIPLLVTKNNRIIMILKRQFEYLSKYQETGKIDGIKVAISLVKEENNNDFK